MGAYRNESAQCVAGSSICQSHIFVRYSPWTAKKLIRSLKATAKKRGLEFSYDARKGKGSHGQIVFGCQLTTIKDLKKEIGPGLLNDMLKQLGLTRHDLA